MGIVRPRQLAAVLVSLLATVSLAHVQDARAQDDDVSSRAQRWQALQQALFPGRSLKDGAGMVKLDAPPRALDAALVPIGIELSGTKSVKGVYVVIDGNPSPLAAHFIFGPRADPRSLKMRVRVDQYTDMHAIAETQDGQLFVATKFVKASGGCSAPAGGDDAAALQDIGHMKLHLIGDFVAGKPEQAVLMVRHPNFNGMQMNQITRYYTPEALVGKQVVAVVNFPPRQIGPFMSQVLTLGVPDETGEVVLLHPSLPVPNGGRMF